MKGTLTPVSFSRRQAPEPRLTPPYVPGKRHERYWTEAELDVLRAHYAEKGMAYCGALLPHRSRASIYGTAKKLGLGRGGRQDRRSYRDSYPELDAAIRAAWPELEGRGAVQALADRLDYPRWLVSQRARVLGLASPHRKEPRWTPAEDALLAKVPLHDPDRAAEQFRAHGFRRSPAAIMCRCRRLGLSRRYRGSLSATAAAEILGVDSKTVTLWILEGLIPAGRRGTKRLVQQGGDAHAIQPADLRRFVVDHLARIDIRKVEKFAFVALLTGTLEEGGEEDAGE